MPLTENMDIKKILIEGVPFKKGKDESLDPSRRKYTKPKGKTISGAAKMKAAYKAKKAAKNRLNDI